MNPIQQEYWRRICAQSPADSFARVESLVAEMWEMVSLAECRDEPGLTSRERDLRVAERLYGADPAARRLLSLARQKVNDDPRAENTRDSR